jgi:hypothetical protein
MLAVAVVATKPGNAQSAKGRSVDNSGPRGLFSLRRARLGTRHVPVVPDHIAELSGHIFGSGSHDGHEAADVHHCGEDSVMREVYAALDFNHAMLHLSMRSMSRATRQLRT